MARRKTSRGAGMRRNPDEERVETPLDRAIAIQDHATEAFWRLIGEADQLRKECTAGKLIDPSDSTIRALLKRVTVYADAKGAFKSAKAYENATLLLGHSVERYLGNWEHTFFEARKSGVSFESLDRVRSELMSDLAFLISTFKDREYRMRQSLARSTSLEDFDF